MDRTGIITVLSLLLLAGCGQDQGHLHLLQQQIRTQSQETHRTLEQMSAKLVEMQAQNLEMRQALARLADEAKSTPGTASSTGASTPGEEKFLAALAAVETRLASLEQAVSKMQTTAQAGPAQTSQQPDASGAAATTGQTDPSSRVEVIEKKPDDGGSKIRMVFPEQPGQSPGPPQSAPNQKP
jgi:hypothetical protein